MLGNYLQQTTSAEGIFFIFQQNKYFEAANEIKIINFEIILCILSGKLQKEGLYIN